jgi:hypothetical protein
VTLGPGDVIGGWRIERKIGAGAMGQVYLARHPRLPRLDVIKVIAADLATDESFRRRFLREADVVCALEHPHVVGVHDRGEYDGMLYIAMQYVSGGDLRQLLRAAGGRLPVARALRIAGQVAMALDAAHRRGLVHRDVKPENVLLRVNEDTPDGDAVLADFGVTRLDTGSTMLTQTGQVLATPAYAAPEQIEAKPVDGRADQYSLACLLFEMLSGRVPFPRDSLMSALLAHVTAPAPLLSAAVTGLPPPVDAVLLRAMSKDPAERYATCREFVAAMSAAAAVSGPAALRAEPPAPAAGPAAPFGTGPPAPAPGPGPAAPSGTGGPTPAPTPAPAAGYQPAGYQAAAPAAPPAPAPAPAPPEPIVFRPPLGWGAGSEAGGQGPSSVGSPGGPSGPPSARRGGAGPRIAIVLAAGVATLLLVVGVGVTVLSGNSDRPRPGPSPGADRSGVSPTGPTSSRPTGSPTRPAPAVAATVDADWTSTVQQVEGRTAERFAYVCPAGGVPGPVWGSQLYTSDSSVCTAAVHAGLITFAAGGRVVVEIRDGAGAYSGTSRNGVTTSSYGRWIASFVFVP